MCAMCDAHHRESVLQGELPSSEAEVSFTRCVNSKDPRHLKGCTRENYQSAAIAARSLFEDSGGAVQEEGIFNEPRSIFYRIFQDKRATMQTRLKWAQFLLQSYFGDYIHVFVVGFAFFIMSLRSSLNETKAAVAKLRSSNEALRKAHRDVIQRINDLTANHCTLDAEVDAIKRRLARADPAAATEECSAEGLRKRK